MNSRSLSTRLLPALALAFLTGLTACGGGGGGGQSAEAPVATTTPAAHAHASSPNPAMTMASAGHGGVFDAKQQAMKFDLATIAAWQDAIRADTLAALGGKPSKEAVALLAEADKLSSQKDIADTEKRLLQGGVIWRLLQEAPTELRMVFEWRLEELNGRIFPPVKPGTFLLDPRIQDLLKRLRYFDPEWRYPFVKTYAERCRDNGVPVPPDWAETGTAWVHQGNLTTNILSPGNFAAVWTYSDPARRGVCVALPRGSGAPGSPAGIICQSASTGAACFWDNKLRTVAPEAFIGWSGQTLRIADLKDGSNLASSCTGCHRGNNVYLIAPDDPTWAKLLRGPLAGPWTGTMTTRVETSTDNRGGHPRYVPLTTSPPRAGWDNPVPASLTCSGSCHEGPVVSGPSGFMPPSCPSLSTGCYAW